MYPFLCGVTVVGAECGFNTLPGRSFPLGATVSPEAAVVLIAHC